MSIMFVILAKRVLSNVLEGMNSNFAQTLLSSSCVMPLKICVHLEGN